MARTDENDVEIMRSLENQGGGLRAVPGKRGPGTIGQNRRALSTISQNILRAPLYPCAVTKRALTEKDAMTNKNPPIPVHRPVTRKYAAQLSNKQQKVPIPVPEETKPTSYTAPVKNDSEDCLIIEAEEYDKAADDFSAPMFVQHTEAILDDIDRMDEEVEMEDVYEEELIVDIDSADKDNQLAVVEYVDEIYAHYKKEEGAGCVSPSYMSKQFDINERMRGILIDWLIEVHYKFELMEETLYLTVNLIDRFLTLQAVVRKKLQLVGITALLLACKYEEVSVPVVEDLIVISDRAYSRQEVLDMEKLMINTLQFHLSVPTPYVFMRRFLKAAESDKKLELLSSYIIELCLVEYGMLKFPPSLLAAAAVFTAQCTLSRSNHWSKTSEKHSNYSEYQLLECSKMMVTLHQNSGKGKLTGVHRKYSTSKYGYAARSEPAHFILNLGC